MCKTTPRYLVVSADHLKGYSQVGVIVISVRENRSDFAQLIHRPEKSLNQTTSCTMGVRLIEGFLMEKKCISIH